MNDFHIFENLDTSFVNLDALVRYLCRRGFVGTIRLSFEGYKAEIALTPAGRLRVSEFDGFGRTVRSGPAAFQASISKSRTPGGTIDVIEREPDETRLFPGGNDDNCDTGAELFDPEHESPSKLIPHVKIAPPNPRADQAIRGSLAQLADFPFDLANHFEDEAASPTDREFRLEMMIDVTSDLLSTIDEVLDQAGLDFALAFQKACADVSDKYPFLEPEKRLFRYSHGFVYISPNIHLRSLTAGIGDVLIRIFDRLGGSTKFTEVYRLATEKVQLLATTRKEEFCNTGMARQVDRLLQRHSI